MDLVRLNVKEWNEDDHPRAEDGKFTDAGGGDGDGGSDASGKGEHPGHGYSKSAYLDADGVIHTSNVYDAQRALFEDRKVELNQVKKISTLIDKLGKTAEKMAEMGKKAPVFNLCNVSVKGTNLFCADTKGIPRVEMPVIPAKRTKEFIKYLKKQGFTVEKGKEKAANLRATQSEIDGAKVATQMARIEKDGFYKRLVVSKDDYILDGHHTWAGQLGLDSRDGNLHDDREVKIARVDISIVKLLEEANKWIEKEGISKKPVGSKSIGQIIREMVDEWDAIFKDPRDESNSRNTSMKHQIKTRTGVLKFDIEPEDYEDEAAFMTDCLDELNDEDVCQLIWDTASNKEAGMVFKTVAADVVNNEFIMSDESIDRMKETISSDGWNLDNFKKNPVALFGHRSDFPIGKWKNIRVVNKELRGTLEMAPKGTSDRIDELRRLIDAGILKAVSVGFVPKQKAPMDEKSDPFFGPFKYLEQELVECSLVSVPANPNSLSVAKSLGISPDTIKVIFGGQAKKDGIVRRGLNGGKADRLKMKGKAMSLSQKIVEAEKRLVTLRDQLTAHVDSMDDSNVTDEQLEVTKDLNEQIARTERTVAMMKDSEKHLGVQSVEESNPISRSLVIPGSRDPVTTKPTKDKEAPRPFALGPKKLDPIDLLVRAGVVNIFAHIHKKPPDLIRQQIYGNDEITKVWCDIVQRDMEFETAQRATAAPARTDIAGWAQELVQTVWASIMQTLYPKSIFPRLSGMGLSLTFGRNGKIIIPTRNATPTIAGSFVGEGLPIPVRQGAFSSQTLVPKKMAVITTWTREIGEMSIPAIEGVLRDAIQEDTSISLDTVLIDSNASTAIRPAGLLNGVSVTTATAGGGFTALTTDIKNLSGALLTGTKGNVRNPVWLMNPQQVNSAGLVAAPGAGVFPFRDEIGRGMLSGWPIIDSGTVPLGTVITLDAADFVAVGGDAPRFEISDQATLHMEDTNPADIVGGASAPGTAAYPSKSMFQTDSIALRLILPVNWVQRRAGTVAYTTSVTW